MLTKTDLLGWHGRNPRKPASLIHVHHMSNVSAIFAVIHAIPPGCVATYGQVAHLAGLPGAARFVGRALRDLPEDSRLPWHRVINAQGRIVLPPDSAGYLEQTRRLTAENVAVHAGKIPLSVYQWQPD